MKYVLITLGVVAVTGIVLIGVVLIKVTATVKKAHGQALYSSVGAWTRIQEFAHAQGNSNYIAEADATLARLQNDLAAWRGGASSGTDFSALEKAQSTAYATTDKNIKAGQNPLAYLDDSNTAVGEGLKPPGMTEYDYLACDGGPHLVLPKELSRTWKGASALALVGSGDYGRACAAIENQKAAIIPVGKGQALALAEPGMSAWGKSPEGWIDIYALEAWADNRLDSLIKRAAAATPTSTMTNTALEMKLQETGMLLIFAGDEPGKAVYGELEIPIPSGSYRILKGHYKAGPIDEVIIYRFQPAGN